MRGPSKSPPKCRKHKVTGQAIVTLSGTDIYLGPHGTKASKLEYDRLIGEWLALKFTHKSAIVSKGRDGLPSLWEGKYAFSLRENGMWVNLRAG